MPNLLVVDDHCAVRHGYSTLLRTMIPDADISEAADSNQAMTVLNNRPIDVIVLDINLEHSSGLSLAPRLIARFPKIRIIFFSMYDDVAIVHRAMQAGAYGYISKSCHPEIMVEAVSSVLKGSKYIEHDLAIKLAAYICQDNHDISKVLSQREFEIFIAVAKGKTRHDISRSLHISDKTVSNSITQLKNKLQVKTNTELVYLALERGFVKLAS